MTNTEKRTTEKVLDYWFALEFLSQDKYPDNWEIQNKIKKHKDEVIKKAEKHKSIEDFILLTGKDVEKDLYELILSEAEACNMKKWGNLTFYIGKVKREHCIECISKMLPFDQEDDNRPEKNSDKIAWASLQLSPEGNYLEHSLSLSTILWALNQIKVSKGNISDALDDESYADTIDELEKKYFNKDKIQFNSVPEEKSEANQEHNNSSGEESYQMFAATAITLKKLQKLYKEIERSYVKGNIENTDQERDAYEEVYGISFQLFKDEATRNKREDDNYLGLDRDYFSDDIKLVLERVQKNKLKEDSYRGIDIQRYITVQCEENSSSKRINLVNPETQDSGVYKKQISELLQITNAPLGKWPSRFMPAFMQQIAINLAIGKGDSELFGINGKVFSVNGPPGTGKTTLLKEIVVNNIIERARLLAEYDKPDDAFIKCFFQHGEKKENAYSLYTRHWYRLKNDRINDYSMLVTSCNNAAVENISKELPRGVIGDLAPMDGDSDELKTMLKEVSKLFDAKQSDTIETTYQGEEYPDIYFTKYAQELLESDDVWGLVAAPLGKKANLGNFYNRVLYPLSRDFYKNKDTAKNRVSKYQEAKAAFLKQLKIVENLQERLSHFGKTIIEKDSAEAEMERKRVEYEMAESSYREVVRDVARNIDQLKSDLVHSKSRYNACNKALLDVQNELQRKKGELDQVRASIKRALESELSARKSVGVIAAVFKNAKYKAAMELADVNKMDAEKQKQTAQILEQEIHIIKDNEVHAQILLDASELKLSEIKKRIKDEENRLKKAETAEIVANSKKVQAEKNYAASVSKYQTEMQRYAEAADLDRVTVLDDDFIERLLSEDRNISTMAQVENPWFSQRYNREREKLFALAMRVNKEFVISSNCCRDNFNTLAHYWGLKPGDENERIIFHKEDKEQLVPSLYQTLFLLVPVMSSTFASVGTLLKDVKDPGVIGMLIIDEAGQAQPQMAAGALYRSRRAVVVGDPKQVEPVVTDDLLLLKKAYNDEILKPYKQKTLSVQGFADRLNSFGTYLDNGSDFPEWVGCPLLVHRRCISPMYEISNQISYNGIMKQQTRLPKPEKTEKFISEKSKWINVVGREKGNRNHFVEAQGKKVCELLEEAFTKNPEPDLYIITPFTTVVSGIRKYIREYCKKYQMTTKINADYILDYDQKKIGTVHTFQGKEADEVIFLLGCDTSKDSEGAITWVNKNIVNVAVTRAKYRLYIIGDEAAWRKSSCVNEAKQIMDTFAIKEIKSILDENLSANETQKALQEVSASLPSMSHFTAVEVEYADGSADYSVDTTGLIRGLNEEFLKTEISKKQLEKFGFSSMEDLDMFSAKIKENLILGMKLFFLLEPVYEVNKEMDASCCAILFCKALELQMKDSFIEAFKSVLPEFKIRGNGRGRENVALKDAQNKEFTLGTFVYIIRHKGETLANKMDELGNLVCDKEWWGEFEFRLNKCTERRNNCCHSGLFSWKDQSHLLFHMFREESKMQMKGLMFESQTGKTIR